MLRTLGLILLNIVYLIACTIPKNKRIWIFSAWNGKKFSDNPKYLFQHVLATEKPVVALWATKDLALYQDLRKAGVPVFYVYSLKGIYYQARAGAAIYTHSLDWEFAAWCIGRTTRRIQLWHGMPIKKIGFDDKLNAPTQLKKILNKYLFPFRSERFDLMIAASEIDKKIYKSAFAANAEAIRVTGFPRNDVILDQASRQSADSGVHILYVPTFRGGVGSEFTLMRETGFDYLAVDQWLLEKSFTLHIKLHPVNFFSKEEREKLCQCKRICLVGNEIDLYETLGRYDIFITDFSSIYFDLLITGKPIIVAPLGVAKYLSTDREGFYFDYEELAPAGISNTWDDIFEKIDRYSSGAKLDQRYRDLQNKYHRYLDNQASERVYHEILVAMSR